MGVGGRWGGGEMGEEGELGIGSGWGKRVGEECACSVASRRAKQYSEWEKSAIVRFFMRSSLLSRYLEQ
uniref:Uncharacterized protein n=1 Tax=Desertifilum tharense IPPAS B-1220 TaxID=1781255 RepID=A0ACD5GYI2_9CYAN